MSDAKPDNLFDAKLSTRDVARIMDVSEMTVYRLVAAGLIDFVRVGKNRGRLRFTPDAVRKYQQANSGRAHKSAA